MIKFEVAEGHSVPFVGQKVQKWAVDNAVNTVYDSLDVCSFVFFKSKNILAWRKGEKMIRLYRKNLISDKPIDAMLLCRPIGQAFCFREGGSI